MKKKQRLDVNFGHGLLGVGMHVTDDSVIIEETGKARLVGSGRALKKIKGPHIALNFKNTESLDVLMEALQRLRDRMSRHDDVLQVISAAPKKAPEGPSW